MWVDYPNSPPAERGWRGRSEFVLHGHDVVAERSGQHRGSLLIYARDPLYVATFDRPAVRGLPRPGRGPSSQHRRCACDFADDEYWHADRDNDRGGEHERDQDRVHLGEFVVVGEHQRPGIECDRPPARRRPIAPQRLSGRGVVTEIVDHRSRGDIPAGACQLYGVTNTTPRRAVVVVIGHELH